MRTLQPFCKRRFRGENPDAPYPRSCPKCGVFGPCTDPDWKDKCDIAECEAPLANGQAYCQEHYDERKAASPVPAPSGEGLDLSIFDGMTPGPWSVHSTDSEYVRLARHAFGPLQVPEGATIIERPPQSRQEAMECFSDSVIVGWMSHEDAKLAAAAPSLLAELKRTREREAKLNAELADIEEYGTKDINDAYRIRQENIHLDCEVKDLRDTVSKLEGELKTKEIACGTSSSERPLDGSSSDSQSQAGQEQQWLPSLASTLDDVRRANTEVGRLNTYKAKLARSSEDILELAKDLSEARSEIQKWSGLYDLVILQRDKAREESESLQSELSAARSQIGEERKRLDWTLRNEPDSGLMMADAVDEFDGDTRKLIDAAMLDPKSQYISGSYVALHRAQLAEKDAEIERLNDSLTDAKEGWKRLYELYIATGARWKMPTSREGQ